MTLHLSARPILLRYGCAHEPEPSRRPPKEQTPEMTMTRRFMMATATMAAATLGGVGGCAATSEVASAEREDCPGKIVCPITGELVCIDQCPAGAGAKAGVALAVAPAKPGACCAGAK